MGTRELQLNQYSVAAFVPTTDRSIIPATEPILASHETKLQLIFGQNDSVLRASDRWFSYTDFVLNSSC
ncbi:hypothetical protein ROBYS_36370 [Roseobacter sp. OBYS 0001]|nr:hypothetical protein ROBYS_36370 [Roseobacter sp. OBYS 0001]